MDLDAIYYKICWDLYVIEDNSLSLELLCFMQNKFYYIINL